MIPEANQTASGRFKPHEDYAVLQKVFPAVRELQVLAEKHGIPDIFQDNGGKILQIALLLGIKLLPGREGNDATDLTTKGEFELKTLNFENGGGFTTHHHLNHDILAKYRKVEWIFAAYQNIEIRAIWLMQPSQMEIWFGKWERMLGSRAHINNPKIARNFVTTNGRLLYSIGGPLEKTKPKKAPSLSERPPLKRSRRRPATLDDL